MYVYLLSVHLQSTILKIEIIGEIEDYDLARDFVIEREGFSITSRCSVPDCSMLSFRIFAR